LTTVTTCDVAVGALLQPATKSRDTSSALIHKVRHRFFIRYFAFPDGWPNWSRAKLFGRLPSEYLASDKIQAGVD
jgi:hypothetical protein